MLDAFYDECAAAIWEYDGLLNKTIGDAIMAIFNFPIRHEDHAQRAVLAAREIQRRWPPRRDVSLRRRPRRSELGVGIGIDSGETSFGEFGRSHRDLTAIGTVVNTAARAQSAAEAGQILVTEAVYQRARRNCGQRLEDVPAQGIRRARSSFSRHSPAPLFPELLLTTGSCRR